MAERLIAAVLKTAGGASSSGVRIPLPPPKCSRSNTAGPSGPRSRKLFTITEAGLRVCRQAARAALTELRPSYPAVLVGLANSPLLDGPELVEALQQRAIALSQRQQTIAMTRRGQQPLPDCVAAIFDYNLSLLEAERAWLARTVGLFRY